MITAAVRSADAEEMVPALAEEGTDAQVCAEDLATAICAEAEAAAPGDRTLTELHVQRQGPGYCGAKLPSAVQGRTTQPQQQTVSDDAKRAPTQALTLQSSFFFSGLA